jgi:transcriptional regulator with XRE-family HTH domain
MTQAVAFAALLRIHRRAAGLSQRDLARLANISAREISDLERGVRRAPYRPTVEALIQALGLDPQSREELERSVDRSRTRRQRRSAASTVDE